MSEPDAHPDESRLSAMLTLYAVERSDYQAAVQLNLAAIGAGLAYAVPVGALLLSRCQVGRGCEGTGDVVLLLAPLPALGLLGFLLANEALLERRARYLAVVEAELAALVRGREGARRVPYFVRGLLTQVYGPAPPWQMRLAATSWAVVAFTMITAVCIAALLFLRPSAVNWVVRALYLGPLLGLGAAGLELMWLNVGAPVPSTLERMLRVIGRRRPEPHVDVPDPRDG